MTYLCDLEDDENGSSNYCVFDTNEIDSCDQAVTLVSQGLCKKDCRHWVHCDSLEERQKNVAQYDRARTLIKEDAVKLREEIREWSGGRIMRQVPSSFR
jgi:hypothetical protein